MARGLAQRARAEGFTLIQVLVVLGIVSALALVSGGVFKVHQRSIGGAKAARCDVQLISLSVAIGSFREENGRSPLNLQELVARGYMPAMELKCPSDPELVQNAGNATYTSYEPYYLIREPRDSGDFPLAVCPHHEALTQRGVQAYKGQYSRHYKTAPVLMKAGEYSGSVTVSRPGVGVLGLPGVGKELVLRGGDRVVTGAGTARLRFSDNSAATVSVDSSVLLMQSFIEGRTSGPLYSLVRQLSGTVDYYVSPGSFFDVATPTSTVGALGTRFKIQVLGPNPNLGGLQDSRVTVTEHIVAVSTADYGILLSDAEAALDVSAVKQKPRQPRGRSANSFNRGNNGSNGGGGGGGNGGGGNGGGGNGGGGNGGGGNGGGNRGNGGNGNQIFGWFSQWFN